MKGLALLANSIVKDCNLRSRSFHSSQLLPLCDSSLLSLLSGSVQAVTLAFLALPLSESIH